MLRKTRELTGWELDYATSVALGQSTILVPYRNSKGASIYANAGLQQSGIPFRPTKELGITAQIIQSIGGFELKNWLESKKESKFEAHIHNYEGDFIAFGEDMAQACLRVFIMMKLGQEVEIPSLESLLESQP